MHRILAACWVLLLLAALAAWGAPAPKDALDSDVTQGALRITQGDQVVECPLKHTDVQATISGFIARVRVTQTFVNIAKDKIEAVYVFPLPHTAAISEMTMVIGDRRIVGVVKRRADAREIYEEALRQGQTASLLEQERPNIFTQSVGNIKPGQEVKIEIAYFDVLKYDDGGYEFHFPMVIGPRYNADAPFAGTPAPKAPQAAAPSGAMPAEGVNPAVLKPGVRNGHDISLDVELDAGVLIQDLKVVNHKADVRMVGKRGADVTLDKGDAIPNKDFVMRYSVLGDKPQMALLAHSKESGQGYFMLMIQPGTDEALTKAPPREMVFIVDRSGSMNGANTEKARATMREFLKRSKPGDTLQVVLFSDEATKLFEKPLPATAENIEKALAFNAKPFGGGGTQTLKGIKLALDEKLDPVRMRTAILITDGDIGNEAEVVKEIGSHAGERMSLSVIGIGAAPNRFLVDAVAKQGNGIATGIELNTDPKETVEKIVRRLHQAQLADITIDWKGLSVSELYPRKIPALWAGAPVILFGRYVEGGEATIALNGIAEGNPVSFPLEVKLPYGDAPQHDVLPQVWARNKIEDLMAQTYYGDDPAVIEEVTQVALAYRLMSQYTSFVAVDDSEGGNLIEPAAPPRRIAIAVPLPDGVTFEGIFGSAGDNTSAVDRLEAMDIQYGLRGPAGASGPAGAAGPMGPSGSVRIPGIPPLRGSFFKDVPATRRAYGGRASIANNVNRHVTMRGNPGRVASTPSAQPGSGKQVNSLYLSTTGLLAAAAGGGGGGGPVSGSMPAVPSPAAIPASPTLAPNFDASGGKDLPVVAGESGYRNESGAREIVSASIRRHQEAKAMLADAQVQQKKGNLEVALACYQQALLLENASLVMSGNDDGTTQLATDGIIAVSEELGKARAKAHPALQTRLALVLRNQSVDAALQAIGVAAKMKIELIPGSTADAAELLGSQPRVIYLDLRRATVVQALDWLLTPLHLTWRVQDDGSILVGSARRLDGVSPWVYPIGELAIPTQQELGDKEPQRKLMENLQWFLNCTRAVLGLKEETGVKAGSAVYITPGQLLVYGDAADHARVGAFIVALKNAKTALSAVTLTQKEATAVIALQQATSARWAARAASRTKRLEAQEQNRVVAALSTFSWPLLADASRKEVNAEAVSELLSAWQSPQMAAILNGENRWLAMRSAWCITMAVRQTTRVGNEHQAAVEEVDLQKLAAIVQPAAGKCLFDALAALEKNPEDYYMYHAALYATLTSGDMTERKKVTALLLKPLPANSPLAVMRTLAACLLSGTAESDAALMKAMGEMKLSGDDAVVLANQAVRQRGGTLQKAWREELPEITGKQPLSGSVIVLVNR
ncbi:MAG: VIT domain-containing protein [Armatimonadota bacterium]